MSIGSSRPRMRSSRRSGGARTAAGLVGRTSRSPRSTGCTWRRWPRPWPPSAPWRSAPSAATRGAACCAAWVRAASCARSGIDPVHAEVARESFRRAGFENAVHLHLGPASEKLRDLDGEAPFDMAFIDADKEGYAAYLEWDGRPPARRRLGALRQRVSLWPCESRTRWARTRRRSSPCAGPTRCSRPGGRFRSTMLPTGEGLALGVKIR